MSKNMHKQSRRRNPLYTKQGLIARGDVLSFVMQDDTIEELPKGWFMLHDPSGALIDKCTFICTKCTLNTSAPVELPPNVRESALEYFGEDAVFLGGFVDLPEPPWHLVGVVKEIRYDRHGQYEDKWYHPFANRGEGVELYQNESRTAYLLVLPDHCIVNERGFVKP